MPPLPIDIVAIAVIALAVTRPAPVRRAWSIGQQKLHHLLGRLEDPTEAIDLAYQRQLESLQQVRRGVAEVVTAGKRLEMQAAQLQQSESRLQAQARTALTQGREDLARLALTRAQAAHGQIAGLRDQVQQVHQQQAALEVTAQKLQAKVEAFRTQRETLRAQYSAAQASVRIGETVSGLSTDAADAQRAVERAHERTQDMQARAAAIDQLIDSGTLEAIGSGAGDDIDRQLRLTGDSTAVDQQLASLREQLHLGSGITPPPQLSTTNDPPSTTEDP